MPLRVVIDPYTPSLLDHELHRSDDDNDLDLAIQASQFLLAHAKIRPSILYQPGRSHDLDGNPINELDNGALQFHKAPHIYRLMAPGNGFSKTTCAATEVDWWGYGDHPYQEMPSPARPRTILWVSQKFQQYEIQKPMIEKWWPDEVRNSYNGQEHSYAWPDGTKMFVITSETDWSTIQGIEPDLVVIDEECLAPLWRELQRRRRGLVRTKYCITATATHGLTWTYSDLYLPWKEYHEALNISDEREMMRAQRHEYDDSALKGVPAIWVWPRGSHADNPTATKESWALEQTKATGSPVEREVRLYGGFRMFSGQPVFSPEGLERQRPNIRPGRIGHPVQMTAHVESWTFVEDGPTADGLGQIELWEEPKPHKRYAMGFDSAYGLADGDFDAAVIFDADGEQVCEVHGHWGEKFADVLRPLLDWYKAISGVPVFVVGERAATGLPILRALYEEGYWVYAERDEATRGEKMRDKLGHAPGQQDITVQWMRKTISDNPSRVIFRSSTLFEELTRFSFMPKGGRVDEQGTPDKDLRWSAPKGFHDDLCRASCYGHASILWLPPYDPPPPEPPTGSLAAVWAEEEREKDTSHLWETDED